MAGGFHSTRPFHHRVAFVANVTSKLPSALKLVKRFYYLFQRFFAASVSPIVSIIVINVLMIVDKTRYVYN